MQTSFLFLCIIYSTNRGIPRNERNNMIISFAGHSAVSSMDRLKELAKEIIRKNIVDVENVVCYIGGYGEFDEICAQACRELKAEGEVIEVVYVSPYLTLSEQEKIKQLLIYGLYDSSIYPPIENVLPRFAILKRNEWMIKNADLIIVYITHTHGGAYKSLQVARQKKKRIINISDFL